LPAYCTSLGKVLLAWLPPDEQAAALGRVDFSRRGPNTITSRTALVAELKRVRENGYAINNEELAYGLRSIAAPVLDHQGFAAAALNLAVHSSMVSMDDLTAKLSETVRRVAADISEHLGYRPA
jgi:IclR family pca regulon transcriptional regulator